MNYRFLSDTGLSLSELTLGFYLNGTSIKKVDQILKTGIDNGITSFDIADEYEQGNTIKYLGKSLQNIDRNNLAICSKVGLPWNHSPYAKGLSEKNIRLSVDFTLKHLNTDYIDILLIHRMDPNTNISRFVTTIHKLYRQGKILYWGVSRSKPDELAALLIEAQTQGCPKPTVYQGLYNLFSHACRQYIFPFCKRFNIGFIGHSPLSQGVLSGKYLSGDTNEGRANNPAFNIYNNNEQSNIKTKRYVNICKEYDTAPSGAAVGWTLTDPTVTSVAFGASHPDQIIEVCNSYRNIINNKNFIKKIEEIFTPFQQELI